MTDLDERPRTHQDGQVPPRSPMRPDPQMAAVYRRRRVAASLAGLTALAMFTGMVRAVADPGEPASVATLATAAPSAATPSSTPSAKPTSKPSTSAKPSASSPAAQPTTSHQPVVQRGSGTFTNVLVPGSDTAGTGRQVTYALAVENGINANSTQIATFVRFVLAGPRGWQSADHVRFVQVTPDQVKSGKKAQITITIASPATVDKLCAPLKTEGKVSCGKNGRAVLNYDRWVNGVSYYGNNLAGYRTYLINHEIGHDLGHPHAFCAGPGSNAPVMQQQTLGLHGCKPWPWPVQP